VVVLAVLIGAVAWLIGLQLWGWSEVEAARFAVDHYHNRQAQVHLQAYLSVWSHDPPALLLAARTARRSGAFEDAEHFLNDYEKARGKDDDDLILERILLQAERGRVDRVADFCAARVRDNHPTAPLILEAQAAGLIRVFRVLEANERLQTWLKIRPNDCQALMLQGQLFYLQGRVSDAAASYARVVELDPDNEDARLRLSTVLLETNRGGEAYPHLEYLRRAVPDDPRVLVRLAQCRLAMGQTDEGRRLLDGVLASNPHYPDALAARGKLAMEDGDMAAAEGWLREAVARDPGANETRYHLYRCLVALGKDKEAKEEQKRLDVLEEDLKGLQELIGGKMQQTPNDPALHTRAGVIALRAGAVADGVRWLESALELDPNYAPAHQALAAYYEQVGDRSRAAEHLAQAK
jgi:predicted Zn-dependent protease